MAGHLSLFALHVSDSPRAVGPAHAYADVRPLGVKPAPFSPPIFPLRCNPLFAALVVVSSTFKIRHLRQMPGGGGTALTGIGCDRW
ncbi:hypothetical protein KC352_g28 [Hortaea werneckii]|nr:hypothetical protein KC352_g28 [Hortaea werneckii]